MSYRVKWQRRPKVDLANAYLTALAAGRGRAVTQAAAQIDSLLQNDPLGQGESRAGGLRMLVIWPLVVDYEIQPARRRVIVHALRYSSRRRP
jgi:hypothetical protein